MIEGYQRPRGLSITALVMLGFIANDCVGIGWSFVRNASHQSHISWLLYFAFLAMGVLGIWGYWLEENWARRLVLAYSMFIVWFSLARDYSYLTRWEFPRRNYWLLVSTLEVIFAAFLLFWLNTPKMQAFFEKSEPVPPSNRFLNALERLAVWGTAFLLLPLGILLGASDTLIRAGLSNAVQLTVSAAGPPLLACLLVSIYYKLRKDRKTPRRFVFFIAAWTFAFGFLLITRPSPLRRWFQYYGGVMRADYRLQYYEGNEESSDLALEWKNRQLVKASYSTAEKWHLWGISLAEGFGPASPLLAKTLEDAGDFYKDQSQYANALPLFRRSMAVWEKAFGPDNHFAAHVRGKLNEAIRSQEASQAPNLP